MQRDNKTGQKGTNTMFVMMQEEIQHALQAGKKFTYANPVVDHRPQKDDPNWIQITAWGNLIKYGEELLVPPADLITAKLHWNSVVSIAFAKYMCINIISHLTAKLEYFEYMTIPLTYFITWIVQQYDLNKHVYNGESPFGIKVSSVGLTSGGNISQ